MDYTRLQDAINANEGRAYITRGGRNRKLFELSKLTATAEVKTRTKQMLGNRIEQTKPTGAKITGSLTLYLMTSDWMDYVEGYLKTGRLEPITIQTVMEDPQSTVGRSEVLLTGVLLTKVGLAMISDGDDADATFDTDFTANGMRVLGRFNEPTDQ